METKASELARRVAEIDTRLNLVEGRFPKNSRRSTAEGHVHKPAAGSGVSAHSALTGLIAPADDHTQYMLLAGRAGTANNAKLSTDSTGILTGSGAASGILRLIGTDNAAPGVVEVQRASVTASTDMLRGIIGVEANPRWAFRFSSGGLSELALGPGGATAPEIALRRASGAIWELRHSGVSTPQLRSLQAADTQPRWRAWDSGFFLGPGGATAPDTGFKRGADGGGISVPGWFNITDRVHLKAVLASSTEALAAGEGLLYSGAINGYGSSKFWFYDDNLREFGPIGMQEGILRRFTFPIGGFAVTNPNSVSGIAGANFWGLMSGPTAYGSATSDIAYSTGMTLNANITSGQTTLVYNDPTAPSPAATLNANITASDTSVQYASAGDPFAVGDCVQLDSERMRVTAIDTVNPAAGGTLTVTRGYLNTTTAAHTAGISFSRPSDLIIEPEILVIGTEKMLVIQVTTGTNTASVSRGYQGTIAAAHTAGDAILRAGVPSGTCSKNDADGVPTLQQDTGLTSGTNMGLEWPMLLNRHGNPILVYQIDLISASTDIRFWCGFTDQTLATMNASDNPAGNYWGIQYSTARGDTEWKAVSKDATTQNVQATGWGAPSLARYFLRIEALSTGTVQLALFDGTWSQIGSNVIISVNVPDIELFFARFCCGIRNLAAASKRMEHTMGSILMKPAA